MVSRVIYAAHCVFWHPLVIQHDRLPPQLWLKFYIGHKILEITCNWFEQINCAHDDAYHSFADAFTESLNYVESTWEFDPVVKVENQAEE